MELLRNELETLLGDWDKRLANQQKNMPVYLLQTLTDLTESIEKKQSKTLAENFLRRKKKGKQ
jgi:hypothetical protein